MTDDVTISRSGEWALVSVEVPTTWTLGDHIGEATTKDLLADAIDRLRDARRYVPVEPLTMARACERCGASFVAHANHARFCSGRCRVAAHRQSRRPPSGLDSTDPKENITINWAKIAEKDAALRGSPPLVIDAVDQLEQVPPAVLAAEGRTP